MAGVLVERDGELGHLHRLLDELGSSGGRVVLVRGEAGVGKTALVRRFVTDVEDRTHVLVGACDDLVTPVTLGPVWDMARAEPSLGGPLELGNSRVVMEQLLGLLLRGLRPSVVVVEDVQWADEATLDVLRLLGRRIQGSNGLVLVTYRDGEVDTDHPLRGVIGALAPEDLVRITLGPLSLEGVARLVEGSGLDAGEVMALTGGNPLFVTEVVASGAEGVPSSVSDAVLGRVAGLSSAGRRVVEVVSVAPGGLELGVVEELVGSAAGGLAQAEQRRLLVVRDGEVGFRHELVRRAVESVLGDTERRRLNRELLGVLIGRGAGGGVVVHHARVAGDVDVLVEYGPRAAREAMAAESHREALEHLRSLEPYLERLPIPEQAALWMDRAQVEEVLARPEAVESITRAIDLYREAGADRGLARALTRAVRSYDDTAGDSGMAEACAGEAVALLDTGTPSVELAEALGQQAWLWVSPGRGRLGRAIEWADRAIEVAEEVGAERVIVDALISKGLALLYWFDDPAGYVALEESAERAAAVGYGYGEARALFNLACDALWNIDLDRAAELTRRAGEVAVRHEIEIVEARSRPIRAFIALYRGDWAAAEELVLEHAGTQTKAGVEDSALTLGAVLGRMGRPGGRDLLDLKWRAGVAVAETTGEIQALVPAAIFLAEWMWLTGDEDPELIERFLDALEPVYGHRIDDTFVLAFWLWELGHLPEIPDWFDEPVPPARAERRRPWRLVMTGHPREAAAIWEAKGCPYERALALMHGDDTDRIEALRIFDDLGAVTAAVRLRGILREEGVRVPRGPAVATRRHPAGLTSRQAEVLDLVAEGLTNSEIADRLFVSPRTVDNHVAAILTKLDAPDRDAAVDTARELELLGS